MIRKEFEKRAYERLMLTRLDVLHESAMLTGSPLPDMLIAPEKVSAVDYIEAEPSGFDVSFDD